MLETTPLTRAATLPCWSGPVDPQPLGGGITNTNFVVEDAGQKYVVRIGADIPVHGVMRFNEQQASRASHACGLSPEVIYTEPGVLVIRFVEGNTLSEEDLRQDDMLKRVVPLLKTCHQDIPRAWRGPILSFWPFLVMQSYAAQLREDNSRVVPTLERLMTCNQELEANVGAVQMVFGHNDLLGGNLIDDGKKLWLIDFDYAGLTSPLFDLSNLASNNELSKEQEHWLLETYFDVSVDAALWRRYNAMKCASLLREAMWSMVSEHHSTIDFDYVAYTEKNLERFERAWDDFQTLQGK